MQWKSLLLAFSAATAALARSHGHQRRHAHSHADDLEARQILKVPEVNIQTVFDLEVVVVTATEPAPPAPSTASTTTTSHAHTTKKPLLGASIGININPLLHHTTKTTPKPNHTPKPSPSSTKSSIPWTSQPPSNKFTTTGFGTRTNQTTGSGVTYTGNVGSPWGSNIIPVPSHLAHTYKYITKFKSSASIPWTVTIWNKIGPTNKIDGWYNHSALTFTLPPNKAHYIAFDENSQGGWGAAPGTELPVDEYGGYSCTWGEFDFGNEDNAGWSGWDVSAIQAQAAGQEVQGMRICDADGSKCSFISGGAERVRNAYTKAEEGVDGIGGSVGGGAVRLVVDVAWEQ